MRVFGKLILAGGAVLGALAVLVVLYVQAHARGRMTSCRNNLRHLGDLAVRNWSLIDPSSTGRRFWQQVREAQYKDVHGKWQPRDPEPFVCPVLGKTRSDPDDPATIDYLGPSEIRRQPGETPRGEPIGADRCGNHASGGNILWLDTSVEEIAPVVESKTGKDPTWLSAIRRLKD